jgi:nucleotidyltransferase substrate binding protein (TIGR01987 family)
MIGFLILSKYSFYSMKDIRWKQRFQNFKIVFQRLKDAMEQENLNELERNGLIQRFEFTIDISWKVLKDYLVEKGFQFKPSPKDTLRQAQQAGLIDFAQSLIDGLDIRNELSHDYSGEKFESSESVLRNETFPLLKSCIGFFYQKKRFKSGKS